MSKLLYTFFLFLLLPHFTKSQTLQWAKYGQGPQGSTVKQVASDKKGNTIMVGDFEGSLTFDIITLHSLGSINGFITKHDSLGNLLWAKQITSDSLIVCTGAATDTAGNIFVTGFFRGEASIDSISLIAIGESDIFLAKFDKHGNALWAVQAGSQWQDRATSIATDIAGNAYICGEFNSDVLANYQISFGPFILYPPLSNAAFLAKYNSQGQAVYAKQAIQGAGSIYGMSATAISADQAGNVYLSGNFSDSIYFDNVGLYYAGLSEALYLVKYDTSGSAQWARSFYSPINQEAVYSLATDATGNCYVGGYFYYNLVIDTPVDTFNFFSNNSYAGFVASYDEDGNFNWLNCSHKSSYPGAIPSEGGFSYVKSLAMDQQGRLMVAGYFDHDLRLDSHYLYSGSTNIMVAALDTATGYTLAAMKDGGSSGISDNARMALHVDGSFIVAGDFSGSPSLGSGQTISSQGSRDIFLAHYSFMPTTTLPPVAASEPLALNKIAIYPNPATNIVNIRLPGSKAEVQVTIYDMSGREVYKTFIQSKHNQIELPSLHQAMYILELTKEYESQRIKLIIAR